MTTGVTGRADGSSSAIFYRKVWSRTTPAERMQMLEQMLELARQSGALQRAIDRKLAEARRGWES